MPACRTQGKWTKISHLFDNLNWSVIIYDKKDQTYWLGLINGIAHYDKEFQKIRSYSQEERNNDPILICILIMMETLVCHLFKTNKQA